jgi:hypothetical protein
LQLTGALTHARRRWAFVCGLLAAGWRECGVRSSFFFFLFFSKFNFSAQYFIFHAFESLHVIYFLFNI